MSLFAYIELNLSSPLGVGNVFGAFSEFFSCYTTLIKESLALSGLICNPLLLVKKKLGMLIYNNSSFNLDVTLTIGESTLTVTEPHCLEVNRSI